MKAKKPAAKSAKKSKKVSAKKSAKKSEKKQSSRVKICEACMNIRNGLSNSPAKSQGSFVPHTCGKTDQQLREFSYNMRILNGIRRKLPYGSEFDDC